MLRIKKDVDLKELEKFGFKKDDGYEIYSNGCFEVIIETRKLHIFDDIWWNEDIEEFFDLVSSGMVEKVSEGDNE